MRVLVLVLVVGGAVCPPYSFTNLRLHEFTLGWNPYILTRFSSATHWLNKVTWWCYPVFSFQQTLALPLERIHYGLHYYFPIKNLVYATGL